MKRILAIPVPALITAMVALGVGALAQSNPFTFTQTYCLGSAACVLTYHNDNNRDGVNANETILKASTLSTTNHPQPQWLASTDGLIYTQPLYIHQMLIGSVHYNLVYVATENNTVYAFDDTGTQRGYMQLNSGSDLGAGYTEIALPYTDTLANCTNLVPEIGITGTPVIDVSVTPPVIYLVTTHEDINNSTGMKSYRQKFHGLFADTLAEIPGSPVILNPQSFNTNFEPNANLQRAGLTLLGPPIVIGPGANPANIWVSFGSNCDDRPYHGFEVEFAYNYAAPAFTPIETVFDPESSCPATTRDCQSGIWMGGAAPAADLAGNVYLVTGNGDDAYQGSGEYSNSVVKVNKGGLQDFYSPPDYHALNVGSSNSTNVACTNGTVNNCPSWCFTNGPYCQRAVPNDWDLGSGGVTLLSPAGFSPTNPELVAAGKQGMQYVVFSGNMGGIDSESAHPDEYACTTGSTPAAGTIRQCFGVIRPGQRFGGAAFFAGSGSSAQNYLYVAGATDPVNALQLQSDGTFNTTPVPPSQNHNFAFPGAAPAVTWNSAGLTTDAIVWGLDTGGYGNVFVSNDNPGNAASVAQLWAYGAVPSGAPSASLPYLWDTRSTNNDAGMQGAVKFVVPTIADGKIFLAGGAQNYYPGCPSTNGTCTGTYTPCPTPSATVQPTACGALAMFK
ncbi:MAG TPA: hypothetical protein VN950_03385 [Terriglobales bacterium]|nr:hypothetical protein [Terriglobales bacterium]